MLLTSVRLMNESDITGTVPADVQCTSRGQGRVDPHRQRLRAHPQLVAQSSFGVRVFTNKYMSFLRILNKRDPGYKSNFLPKEESHPVSRCSTYDIEFVCSVCVVGIMHACSTNPP